MEALAFVLVGFLAGLVVNVLSDRLPIGLGISGLWVCPACQSTLPARQGVGLWRQLTFAGYCPSCRERLPRRHALVEVVLAGLFGFLYWRYGLSVDFGLNAFYLVLLALIFVIDLEHRLVLNVVILPAIVVAFLTALVRPGPVPALIGGAIGFVLLLVCFLVYPQGLGAGDVKLAAFIGLLLGWPLVLPGLFLGFALAAVVSIGLLITRRAGLRSYIPYAPFIVVGAYVALIYPVY